MTQSLYGKRDAHGSPSGTRCLIFPEILSDPLIRTLMRADGVDARALESCLRRIAAKLPHTPHSAPAPCAEPC